MLIVKTEMSSQGPVTQPFFSCGSTIQKKKKKGKFGFVYEEIINFQQMIRYKGVLLRKDWKIGN